MAITTKNDDLLIEKEPIVKRLLLKTNSTFGYPPILISASFLSVSPEKCAELIRERMDYEIGKIES